MDPDFLSTPRHAVAVIGGACAGAEAAEIFAKAGILTVVVDQNSRPFGKIEDGLPRWHARQRSQEYEKIGNKLKSAGVEFVPLTPIGEHVSIEELRGWGFSAVVLACGAWGDRPLAVPDAERYVDKGLIYQNPFIYWFNHFEEESYDGPRYEIEDGALVVGGGLASIDVVKALNMVMVARRLRERGMEAPSVKEMDHLGLAKVLEDCGVTMQDLGLSGCTLVYRRSVRDMPVAQFKDGADQASREKTMDVREKLMGIVASKYLVNTRFNTLPKELLVEDGRVVGLKVVGTRIEGRKVIEIAGTEEDLRGSMVVASIGSIPKLIPGLPVSGEFYDYDDWDNGVVKGMTGVFGVGNVVTGQGNISISRRHSKKVADHVLASYLGVGEPAAELPPTSVELAAAETAESVKKFVASCQKLSPAKLAGIMEKVRARQKAVGYEGDFDAWIAKVTPPDRV